VGRDVQPSAAIVDSQSVKGADTVGAATRGFDSGKRINDPAAEFGSGGECEVEAFESAGSAALEGVAGPPGV